MVNPSINNGTETFTFQDGDCDSVSITKNANLDINPIPTSDSSSAYVLDFTGALKNIVMSGVLTPASSSVTSISTTKTIAEQQAWLEALINGSQSGYTVSTSYQTTKKMYIKSMTFTEQSGEVNMVAFRIELVEGS